MVGKPAVIGLDAGRKLSERRHRHKRIKDRVLSTILGFIALGFLGAGAWFGYQVYVDHEGNEAEERRARIAEYQRQNAGQDLEDKIEQLGETPKWNGPGNATFGVGDGPVEQP